MKAEVLLMLPLDTNARALPLEDLAGTAVRNATGALIKQAEMEEAIAMSVGRVAPSKIQKRGKDEQKISTNVPSEA